jgi:exodeoxyribonuclease VII small subunit
MPAKKKAAAGDAQDMPPFEEALQRLDTIVEQLEGGELTLEQSLSHYEEGMKLSRGLTKTLDEAEKRIERLVAARGDAPPTTRPMETQGDDESGGGDDSSGQLPF